MFVKWVPNSVLIKRDLVSHFCIKHDQIVSTGSGHLPLELNQTKNIICVVKSPLVTFYRADA